MKVPFPWSGDDLLADAYQRGWNHGHGIACHNVPTLGQRLWSDSLGRVTVDAENCREVHEAICHEAVDNSRALLLEDPDLTEAWIQPGRMAKVSDFVPDAGDLMEQMSERALDNGCPDEIDDPFIFGDIAEQALNKALLEWANRFVKTNWWEPAGDPILVGKRTPGQVAIEECGT